MAIATLTPDTEPITDPVSFEEAALLFQQTQLPEFALALKPLIRKLQRWAKEDRLVTEPRGRAFVVSYSDLLEAHKRRHPAPGA